MVPTRQLPPPTVAAWAWQHHAACRAVGSELFFGAEGESGPDRVRREARAKQVCRGCPVREPCRGHALAVGEAYGVWGGMSETERAAARRSARSGTSPD